MSYRLSHFFRHKKHTVIIFKIYQNKFFDKKSFVNKSLFTKYSNQVIVKVHFFNIYTMIALLFRCVSYKLWLVEITFKNKGQTRKRAI